MIPLPYLLRAVLADYQALTDANAKNDTQAAARIAAKLVPVLEHVSAQIGWSLPGLRQLAQQAADSPHADPQPADARRSS